MGVAFQLFLCYIIKPLLKTVRLHLRFLISCSFELIEELLIFINFIIHNLFLHYILYKSSINVCIMADEESKRQSGNEM